MAQHDHVSHVFVHCARSCFINALIRLCNRPYTICLLDLQTHPYAYSLRPTVQPYTYERQLIKDLQTIQDIAHAVHSFASKLEDKHLSVKIMDCHISE